MKLATTTEDFERYTDSYLEKVKYVYEAGFRHIDLSLYSVKDNNELFYNARWKDKVSELNEFAKEIGVDFVQSHSPTINNLVNEEGHRDALWKTVRAIEICGMLGIPNVVVHSGWRLGLNDKEQWFKENKSFCEELFPTMEKYNVNVLCENSTRANMSDYYFPTTGSDMREFVEYVNHPLFHACWDTGHANIEGSQYDEITALGKEMYAIHFNDNRGKQDEHIIPFMGTLNADEIMCALKDIGYSGILTFECCNALRSPKFWLGDRREFTKETRLAQPPLLLQKEIEKFMYCTGKYVLDSYNCFEE